MSDRPHVETERLVLRAHRLVDFEHCAELWADENVVRFISGKPSTREEAWSRFIRYAGHWEVLGYGYWIVEERASGRFLGEAGFANYQRAMTPTLGDRPEAGWVFSSEAHGQGYATEAVHGMLKWADTNLTSETTVCIIAPEHIASIRVAHKVGFRKVSLANYRGKATEIYERQRYFTE